MEAAQLVARPAPGEPGLWLVDIPVSIRTAPRRFLSLEVEVEVPHLADRKGTWRALAGKRIVSVPEQEWDTDDAASFCLVAVPVASATGPFDIAVSGHDVRDGQRIRPIKLSFGAPLPQLPEVRLPFGDTTSPTQMREHPLGVQKHYKWLIDTILEGKSSFMISAPRRFGKTTLLEAVAEELQASDVLTVGPIRVSPESPVSSPFVEACEKLSATANAYVDKSWTSGAMLPAEATFDEARRRAHENGRRAIYLLFDEAQALFARAEGKELAEHLKQRIEGNWGRDRPGLASVRIGLVGQPQLQRRIAGQLDGVFGPRSKIAIDVDPNDIESFLRETTRGLLQSSRAARQLLADVSRSLLILRHLLENGVLDALRREGRIWFLRSDVQQAIEDEISLAVNAPTTLGRYVLDALNGDDNLTNWRPLRSYPVAIAWAITLAEEPRPAPARRERARQLLNGWAPDAHSGAVPLSRIEESLVELREATVLNEREEFRSPLLSRYLCRLGLTGNPFRETSERAAMHSLLVDRIELPPASDLIRIGNGGQATVYRATVGGRDLAYRIVDISDEVSRTAFVATCTALSAIEGTRTRSEGVKALPVVRQAGFIGDRAERGAIVYDFVPGADLSERSKTLFDPAVVALGAPLAEALLLLEKRRVVHRDIKPDNVVVGPSGSPVIVDFGLARLLDHGLNTRLADDRFVAPEAQGSPPVWSSKADVYSLAKVLQFLRVAPDPSTALSGILREALLEDPSARMTPGDFAMRLRALADQMRLDEARESRRRAFESRIARLPQDFRPLAERHVGDMVASALRLFSADETLLRSAQLLDEVFEFHCSASGRPDLRHLTNLPRTPRDISFLPSDLQGLCKTESYAVGEMRHGNAHRGTQQEKIRNAASILRSSASSGHGVLQQAVVQTAERLERHMRVQGLRDLVYAWLQPESERGR